MVIKTGKSHPTTQLNPHLNKTLIHSHSFQFSKQHTLTLREKERVRSKRERKNERGKKSLRVIESFHFLLHQHQNHSSPTLVLVHSTHKTRPSTPITPKIRMLEVTFLLTISSGMWVLRLGSIEALGVSCV